jgi:hypothetical protein
MSVEESFARVERELQAERAAALARIAGRLGELVARLAEMRTGLPSQPGPGRKEQLEAYRAVRQEARLYRWYLEVQREALGLRRHDGLDEHYPIPGEIEA